MKVQLRVAKGPSAGRLLNLAGPEFVIGRAEDCHLRPNSEAVSRRHCTIRVGETDVSLEDLGSRNGSLVNGRRVEGTQVLRNGDHLEIGPLAFELVLEASNDRAKAVASRVDKGHAVSAAPEPDLGARTTSAGKIADVIADWLDEAPTDTEQSKNETKVFKLDDTSRLPVDEIAKAKEVKQAEEPETVKLAESKEAQKLTKPKPAKLPRQADLSKDSQEAAAHMLKKLFRSGNR